MTAILSHFRDSVTRGYNLNRRTKLQNASVVSFFTGNIMIKLLQFTFQKTLSLFAINKFLLVVPKYIHFHRIDEMRAPPPPTTLTPQQLYLIKKSHVRKCVDSRWHALTRISLHVNKISGHLIHMTSIIHVWQRRSWLLTTTSDQPL